MNCGGTSKPICAAQVKGQDFLKSFPTVTGGAASLERHGGLSQDQPLALCCPPQPQSVGPSLKDRHLCPFPQVPEAPSSLLPLAMSPVPS